MARRFVSPDGFTVLVGRSAADNDTLTFRIGRPRDFWLHAAAGSGSHVVVRNPDNVARLPKDTLRFAAGLAAFHSKGKRGGRVAVHVTTCDQVRKPHGLPAGKVTIGRYESVEAQPIAGGAEP